MAADERALLDGFDPSHAPSGQIARRLVPSDPQLLALEANYRAFSSPLAVHSQWAVELRSTAEDLRFFRGDNAYLWGYTRSPQLNRFRFLLLGRYVESVDELCLLRGTLVEDGAFGCITADFETLPTLSRDLLDSVNELSFLHRYGVFENCRQVLDIGAGYGRLAHRMLTAVPTIEHYRCVDAIPRSTFLCQLYVDYRGLTDRTTVIPLPEIGIVPAGEVDLAVNVHSFSEMTRSAVNGWVQWLVELNIKRLFVVPNERDQILSREIDGTRRDCADVLAAAGYELIASEPTIRDPDLRSLLEINDYFLLFASK